MATATRDARTKTARMWEMEISYEAFQDRLDELGGEMPPEVEAEWEDLGGSIRDKIEATAIIIKGLDATALAIREESRRLRAAAEVKERASERLREKLKEFMLRTGQYRVETGRTTVRVQDNTVPTVAWAYRDDQIPEEFRVVKTEISLDRRAVLDAHRAGEPIPEGITIRKGQHIRIA